MKVVVQARRAFRVAGRTSDKQFLQFVRGVFFIVFDVREVDAHDGDTQRRVFPQSKGGINRPTTAAPFLHRPLSRDFGRQDRNFFPFPLHQKRDRITWLSFLNKVGQHPGPFEFLSV